jgi:hypothetical protein
MNGIIDFRMVIQRLEKAAVNVSKILRKNGFKIYDLKESDIVLTSDKSKVSSVYILCCQGKTSDYERFKNQQKLTEMMYEGFKTLM